MTAYLPVEHDPGLLLDRIGRLERRIKVFGNRAHRAQILREQLRETRRELRDARYQTTIEKRRRTTADAHVTALKIEVDRLRRLRRRSFEHA